MGAAELIGVAGSLSLLAGWRLYATVLIAGIAVRFGLVTLPAGLDGLHALANPWILGIAALGAFAELLADKVPVIDSIWDGIHTAIRPVGGALIASSVISANDPEWQVAALLLGGGAALLTHTAKAGTRALVNTSPEPLSNFAVSAAEDVGTAGGLWLVLEHPEYAAIFGLVLATAAALLLYFSWRAVHRIRLWWRRTVPPPSPLDEPPR